MLFDHPILFSSLAGLFSVEPALDGCDPSRAQRSVPSPGCSVAPVAGGDGFRFTHAGALFAPSTKYTFRLAGGVRDLAGIANSLDHRWELTAAGAPAVRGTEPSDGARDVPADSALAVSFTRPMSDASTVPAISVSPGSGHTLVVRNQKDHSRFVVFTGGLLTPGASYQLEVTRAATDEHGQRLEKALTARFTAADVSNREHAVVLAHDPGEKATEVLITDLTPLQDGEPVASHALLSAPRCRPPACGAAGSGAPDSAYDGAALSPQGTWLAVQEQDIRTADGAGDLRVMDLRGSSRPPALFVGARRPAWSPDGLRVAFEQAGRVRILTPGTGSITDLPVGAPLSGTPSWSPDGRMLALPTLGNDGIPHIELADPDLANRYAVPGLPGAASHPAFSPNGRQLAVYRPASAAAPAGAFLVSLAGPLPDGQRLPGDVQPVAYVDDATLLAVQQPEGVAPQLVRVNLSTGEVGRIDLAPGADARSVVVSTSRRNLAYLVRDRDGVIQGYTETAQGTGRRPLTEFRVGALAASVVGLN